MDREPTVGDMMAAYAEDAVDHAQATGGIALDYSPESIRNVETFLQTLYAARPKGFLGRLFGAGPSAQDVQQACKMYGGYIGEVVRRTGGGEWIVDTDIAPGQKVLCLRKGANKCWPPVKVFKRLTNGPEDDVWAYSQVVLQEWK